MISDLQTRKPNGVVAVYWRARYRPIDAEYTGALLAALAKLDEREAQATADSHEAERR